MTRTPVAIIGSGNIGTDLMMKVLQTSDVLEMGALVGIDANSRGLRQARRLGVPTAHRGVDELIGWPHFDRLDIVFDATSARAHVANAAKLSAYGKHLVDLTPAALGPYVVPPVNLDRHLQAGANNVNMVTCGGQATIPIVAAVSAVTTVAYAEIIASIASKSAGPGTRANIDEFTQTTARAIESVGGAARGKAIIILNPAEPPLIMRDTVYCLIATSEPAVFDAIRESVHSMVARVQHYVPGYRLKQQVQFSAIAPDETLHTLLPERAGPVSTRVSVFLEVEGAAHYLPSYAGNLDIMTSAALRVGESIARATGLAAREVPR